MAILKKYLDEFDDFLRMADVERRVYVNVPNTVPLQVVVEGFAKDGSWICYRIAFDGRSNLIQLCYKELREALLAANYSITDGQMPVESSWGKWEKSE